jgi:hypothetical protein
MENIETNEFTEEIVIVGSKYEELADVVVPLYEKGEPIEKKDLEKLFGSETVYLRPRGNDYDMYAVGVYTVNQSLLGYVWSWQSYAMREWLKKNNRDYVAANISRMNPQTELIMATPTIPLTLGKSNRSKGIDMGWAADLPEILTNVREEAQELGLSLLKEELAENREMNDTLKMRINNMLYYLRSNLSGQCYNNCIDIYQIMMRSSNKEVREQGEWFLKTLVSKGSQRQMEWWVNEWLPEFMKSSCDDETLDFYKASGYTLERVEELLKEAPYSLFQRYKVNKYRFAKQLYYAGLPQKIYYRLLTLLTLWEAMRGEVGSQMEDVRSKTAEELFHFIHPAMDEDQERKIHNEVKRLVKRQGIQVICQHLLRMEADGKLLLPPNPAVIYKELVRVGMPQGEGYSEKYFRNHFN